MSEKRIDDGGPAFPCEQGHDPQGYWNETFNSGMSIRDWFAGRALVGLLSGEIAKSLAEYSELNGGDLPDNAANYSFIIADAMLKARKQ
jgi:hypothetical protein